MLLLLFGQYISKHNNATEMRPNVQKETRVDLRQQAQLAHVNEGFTELPPDPAAGTLFNVAGIVHEQKGAVFIFEQCRKCCVSGAFQVPYVGPGHIGFVQPENGGGLFGKRISKQVLSVLSGFPYVSPVAIKISACNEVDLAVFFEQ